jgi:quercetin dioxygenase-like cupin family protein
MFRKCALVGMLLAYGLLGTQPLPEMRLLPSEILASKLDGNQIGSSELTGVRTKVLFGDPAKPGFYSILLFVPANATIQAHSHRDDRMATVVSGAWYFGYGDYFDAKGLKALPAGSVYSEPAAKNHFARTTNEGVVVHISGYGPTDTRYFDPANEPKSK